MKKRLTKLLLLMLCVFIITPASVQAETFSPADTAVSVEIDESGWYVFTRENIANNEDLVYLGIDQKYMTQHMEDEDIYLNAIKYLGDFEHYLELSVKKTPNGEVNNLNNYDRKGALDVAKSLAEKNGVLDYVVYEEASDKYILFSYEENGLYCQEYVTVINGENYHFKIEKTSAFDDSDAAVITELLGSVTYKIDPAKAKENVTEEPKISILSVTLWLLFIALVGLGVFGFIKYKKITAFKEKVGTLYEEININVRNTVFSGGKKEFHFVATMLDKLFPQGDLKDLIVKYVNLHKTYISSGGDVYKTFNYAKDNFGGLEEESYSLLALVMLNVDGIRRFEDCSLERVEPFRKNAKSKIKCVETIANHSEVFGVKPEKRLGARDNAILVAGAKGVERYLDSIVAEDGTELGYVHKSTVYIRDKNLDIEYDLRNYSLRDVATNDEICSVWFNVYGAEDCTKCIGGFAFEKDVLDGKVRLAKDTDNAPQLAVPSNVMVNNVVSTGTPKVTWNKVEGADKYFVYRSLSKDGIYTYQGSSVETNYINSSAIAGNCYYYKVKAVDTTSQHAQSEQSNTCYITCDLEQPVLNITLNLGKPKISWNAVAGASKYEIYRKVGQTGTFDKYYTTTSTFMTNTSAEEGQTYSYKVIAVCPVSSYGNSAYSEEVSITAEPF